MNNIKDFNCIQLEKIIPSAIKHLAEKVKILGGTLYLVGGALRDSLIGRPIKDLDFTLETTLTIQAAINNLSLDSNSFEFSSVVGSVAPVFIIKDKITSEKFEIAVTRREESLSTKKSYNNFCFFPGATIAQDLERRDFFINALAYDILEKKLISVSDEKINHNLKNKEIEHISDVAFLEDPGRFFRAARFAAELQFGIHSKTQKVIKENTKLVKHMSKERIFKELLKGVNSKYPAIFIYWMHKLEIMEQINSIFKDWDKIPAGPLKYHPEGSLLNHVLIVVTNAIKKEIFSKEDMQYLTWFKDDARLNLMTIPIPMEKRLRGLFTNFYPILLFESLYQEYIVFGAWFHDMFKAITPKEEWPSHRKHARIKEKEQKLIVEIFECFPTYLIQLITNVIKLHMYQIDKLAPGKLLKHYKKIVKSSDKNILLYVKFICEADGRSCPLYILENIIRVFKVSGATFVPYIKSIYPVEKRQVVIHSVRAKALKELNVFFKWNVIKEK